MIIGLSGYARSGKDEAAKVLVEEFGFTRIAFADKLRDFLYALNPMVSAHTWENSLGIVPVHLWDVIDQYGWDGYKESAYGTEIRRLLQRLGTEAGRQTLWDSIWIDAALNGRPEDGRYVITDVRFPNEAEAVRNRGGLLWRITRSGVGPANSHPSETSLDDYEDFVQYLNNDGSLKEFQEKVARAADRWIDKAEELEHMSW